MWTTGTRPRWTLSKPTVTEPWLQNGQFTADISIAPVFTERNRYHWRFRVWVEESACGHETPVREIYEEAG
jgi:aromatic ring-cleaving dioxygenase